jgi:mono/diheme cytochrome c family protein
MRSDRSFSAAVAIGLTTLSLTCFTPLAGRSEERVTASGVAGAEQVLAADYEGSVKPLLKERCFPCHGALRQESDLRVDTARAMQEGGLSGPAIEPGSAEASHLVERIRSEHEGERMPPEGRPLSPEEIQLIVRWIEQGAHAPKDEQPEADPSNHWAFRKPVRPEIPLRRADLSHDDAVRSKSAESGEGAPRLGTAIDDAIGSQAPIHPIDAFIDAALLSQGLVPNPTAEKSILLRRVYLDLIGIPPTVQQLQDFLDDKRPDAWLHVVNQLLESPQYGERWGRHWMDIWRYSDWYGRRMVPDVWNSAPQIWRWRDWIVRSLNEDKGYDKMLAEMLAGDEVSPSSPDSSVATGYLIRNWYALNPNDWMRSNVEHTAKAFLGLTMNCAHCHDHKYDPILQDDYFHLRAFFEPIGIRQDRVPGEADPGPFQQYDYGVLRKIVRLGKVQTFDQNPEAPTWFYEGGDERNRNQDRGSIPPRFPQFLGDLSVEVEPIELPPTAWYPGLHPDMQQAILDEHRQIEASRQSELEATRARLAESLGDTPFQDSHSQDVVAVEDLLSWLEHSASEDESGTLPISAEQLALQVAIARRSAASAATESVIARQEADRQRYLAPDDDPTGSQGDLASNEHSDSDEPTASEEQAVSVKLPSDRVESLIREASRLERRAAVAKACVVVLESLQQLASVQAQPEANENRATELETANNQLAKARTDVEQAVASWRDSSQDSEYSAFGPTYPRTSTGRRAALARWLTHPDNPLTARVAINHIWLRHFHVPLAADVADFGRNGAPPTHPELLDWLSVELVESGWSMKHIHRLIVTSQAYQRSSRTHGELPIPTSDPNASRAEQQRAGELERLPFPSHERDPENRYLWRMNPGRMESEVIRDSLLATAGVLDLTMGGQELENSEALTTRRRTLYYSCHPELDGKSQFGSLFDAPDAVECYRRTESVIPQQALALTNSELVHQLSSGLAESIWRETRGTDGATLETFVSIAYHRILSRAPSPAEAEVCLDFLGEPWGVESAGGSEESVNGERGPTDPNTDPNADQIADQIHGDSEAESAQREQRESDELAQRRRASLVRALLNHNDFVTIR